MFKYAYLVRRFGRFMARHDELKRELQLIIEKLDAESGVTPPPGTKDKLKWYLDYIIAILGRIGPGGYLDAHDFGTATPTQEALTEYACQAIWDPEGTGTGVFVWDVLNPWDSTFTINGETHLASEIFPDTKIPNSFDNHVWELANTQDTTPKVFSWANVGQPVVGPATETVAGVLKLYKTIAGLNTDGAITQAAAKNAFDSTANVYTVEQIFAGRGQLTAITLASLALDPIKGATPPRRGDLVQSTIDGRIAQIEMIDTTAGTVAARTLNVGIEELDGKVDEIDGDVLSNQYSMSYHDPKWRAFVVENMLDDFIGQIDVNGNSGFKSVRIHALDYALQNGNKIRLTPSTFQIEKIRNGVAEFHDILEADDVVPYENAVPGAPADAQSFKNQIENIKSLGHILGGVHSQTELPPTVAAIMELYPWIGVPSVNDVIQVEIDSDHSGMATWYTIVSIDEAGNVIYSYGGSYSGSAQQRNFITDPIKIDEEVSAYTTPETIADDKTKFANNSNQGLVKSVFDKMVAKINGASQSVSDLASNVTTALAGKQATLIGTQVTGQNIKTVNGTTLLGTGDIPFRDFSTSKNPINIATEVSAYATGTISENTTKFIANLTYGSVSYMFTQFVAKINGLIQGLTNANTAISNEATTRSNADTTLQNNINAKQNTLVGSGTGQNIKTVGGNNLMGSGDIPWPINGNAPILNQANGSAGAVALIQLTSGTWNGGCAIFAASSADWGNNGAALIGFHFQGMGGKTVFRANTNRILYRNNDGKSFYLKFPQSASGWRHCITLFSGGGGTITWVADPGGTWTDIGAG
jgi:hypothetical protein